MTGVASSQSDGPYFQFIETWVARLRSMQTGKSSVLCMMSLGHRNASAMKAGVSQLWSRRHYSFPSLRISSQGVLRAPPHAESVPAADLFPWVTSQLAAVDAMALAGCHVRVRGVRQEHDGAASSCAANPAIALRLQSTHLAGRVAELGSLHRACVTRRRKILVVVAIGVSLCVLATAAFFQGMFYANRKATLRMANDECFYTVHALGGVYAS